MFVEYSNAAGLEKQLPSALDFHVFQALEKPETAFMHTETGFHPFLTNL
ncbi:MAG: hypothetical protein IMX05_07060 [Hydrogenibacillus schlegelii]|nr:hypothetical protein [Hydrogenibacillus schlegelii]